MDYGTGYLLKAAERRAKQNAKKMMHVEIWEIHGEWSRS